MSAIAPPDWGNAWPRRRMKVLYSRVTRPAPDNVGVVTAFRDGVVTLRSNRRTDGYTEAVQEIGYQGVRPGDLVISSMDAFAGSLGVSDSLGKCSPVYDVYVPRGDSDARFHAYCLRHLATSGFIQTLAKGIRERSTSFDYSIAADLELPTPDGRIQAALADYLDAGTSRLDALIAARRQFVALLDESRRARITRVVARGPLVRVKFLVSLITSGPRGWGDLAGDDGLPFLRSANLRREAIDISDDDLARVNPPPSAESSRSRILEGDVLVGITGANAGWVGIAKSTHVGGYVSQHVALLRPATVEAGWLAYSFVGDAAQRWLLESQYGGTKTQLGLEDLRELSIQVPSRQDQRRYGAELRRVDDHVRAAKRAALLQIVALQERRQALIARAVTGEHETPERVA